MNLRSIIIIALCLIFFLAWYPLMERLGWMPEQEEPDSEETAETTETAGNPPTATDTLAEDSKPGESADTAAQPDETTERQRGEDDDLQPAPVARPLDRSVEDVRPYPADTLTLHIPGIINAKLAANRGGMINVALKKYETYSGDSKVSLGNYRFPYCTLLSRTGRISLEKGEVRTHSERHASLTRKAATLPLTVIESWRLDPEHPYRVLYNVKLVNRGESEMELDDLSVRFGALTAEDLGATSKLSRVGRINLAAELKTLANKRPDSYAAEDVNEMSMSDVKKMGRRQFQWVALHNKYFVFYLSEPDLNFHGCQLATYDVEKPRVETDGAGESRFIQWLHGTAHLPPIKIAAQGERELQFNGYAGPKEYKRLQGIDKGLVSIMRLDLFLFFRAGWMGVISTTILKSLTWIQGIINKEWGYGVAIIIITVVIKTLFWPLTHKSTTSMRKMQKLQPLIKEMREKYKDDAQKMNRKLMELYREHKVNPLGGCLPILFQIPVFFALFNTLRGAIELRQASFLWVADLSLPDTLPWLIFGLPIRPLAILMGGTMFLQQKLAPTTGDPSQKRMMMFMTVFFMFIFYSMPAGLTLYWTTNQVLTIFQNYVIKKFEKDTTGDK